MVFEILGRLLMYIQNKIGLIMLPWDTSILMTYRDEFVCPSPT